MNPESIRQKIESGVVGSIASLCGFVCMFLAVLPNAFQTALSAPHWEYLGVLWYCAMVAILCCGCITGTIFSLYALFVRGRRHAWFGLLLGLFGLLNVPTYLLGIFRLTQVS